MPGRSHLRQIGPVGGRGWPRRGAECQIGADQTCPAALVKDVLSATMARQGPNHW